MKNKNRKTIFVLTEEYKTNIKNPTKEQLIELFNKKYFKTILKIEMEKKESCILDDNSL